MKAIFGQDYNTWFKCHYCEEFVHIGINCVKHHLRKRDTTKTCFIFTELGHLAKDCMNAYRIEYENKEKADNVIKQMRQQLVPKSNKNTSPSNDEQVTQELSDSTIST